jgi:hypothetical protein
MTIDRSRVIGLDPGANGGMAIIDMYRAVAMKLPESDVELFEQLKGIPPCVCVLEQVSSVPGMPSVSAFSFGREFGRLRLAAYASGHEVYLVRPQKWKQALGLIVYGKGLGRNDTEKKNLNKAKAQELFPALRVTHATADALLLAQYGIRYIA